MMVPACSNIILLLYSVSSLLCLTHGAGITILEGDVYVEGVFSLHSTVNKTCNNEHVEPEFVQNMESIRWTLGQLNKDTSNLYGKKIGLRVHTTCQSKGSAEKVGLELAIALRNSGNYMDSVAVIGPDFSSEAEALSRLLSSLPEKYRLLQLGFDTTSASLKDKTKFRNFFRTIPPDNIQVKVMNLLIQELDWTYMAIIYDNDSYGINGVSELLSNVKSKDICFPQKMAIDPFMAQADLLTILKLHLEDLLIHSNIGGILVFGSLKLGTAILRATDIFLEGNPNYTSPVFLFSESSSYFDDQFTNVSRGAFAVSPPRRYVQEFLDYWTTIFTDVDTLYETIASNTYIKLLYEKTFLCELAEAKEHHNCTLPSRETVLNKLKPSLYNQYAVQAAMTITKAVKEVHYKECGTKLFHCTELFNVPRQRFIDVINKLVVKFDDDFSLRLKTFKNPDLQISFNGETDITLPPDYPEYEVYNHQMCAAEENFCFKKIALLAGGDLKLDVFAIKDYDQIGNEMLWPNIRKPQCPDFTLCQECLPEHEDEVHFVPGDMYILGIVPVHARGSSPLTCGPIKSGSIDVVETIRFGIKEAQSSFQDRVPNANIGLIVIDSCNDPQVIQEKILSVYRLGVYADGEFVQVKDKILGYIGGWGTDVSVAVAEVASRLGFVQIGYGCTATALSNRSLYPYFLRTSAPDGGQAEAMVQIVKYLGYNLVQILHSTCTYGEGGRNMILDAIERNNNTICVAQSVGFSRQINPVDLIESINKQKDAKVILLFVSSFDIGRLLPILNDAFQNKEYLFIASEGWGTRKVINGFINLKGAITLSSELHVNAKFQDHLKDLKPDGSDPDPWLRPYMENTFGCYYEWSYNKSSGIQCSGTERLDANQNYKIDAWAPFVEKAVYALLLGAGSTLGPVCGSTGSLCESFSNNTALLARNVKNVVMKDEFGRPRRVFNDNGDGLVGYNIYSVAFDGVAVYESIGSVASSAGEHLFKLNAAKWKNIIGTEVESRCGNQPICKACFQSKLEMPKPASRVSDVYVIVIAILGVLCLVFVGIQIWTGYRYGCCIKLENGKVKANCCIQTSIYERTYRPDGSEDQEMGHYDIIRNTGPYHGNNELIQSDSDIGQIYTHGAYSTNVKRPLDHSVSTRERGNGTGESSASGSFISKRSVQTSMGDANEYIKPSDSLPELDIIKEDAMPPLPSSKDIGHVREDDAIHENADAKSIGIIKEDAMPLLLSSKDTGHVREDDAIHENADAKSIGIIKEDAMPPLPSSKDTAHVREHGAINENADASRTDSLSDDTDKNDYMRPLVSKCNSINEEESKCRSDDDDSKCSSNFKEDLKHTTMDIEQDSEHNK